MATPDDARRVGGIAAAHARSRLAERGIDPASCTRLLAALASATAQVVAAREQDRDTSEYRHYLEAVYDRLDADPVLDELPRPPRRTLALRW